MTLGTRSTLSFSEALKAQISGIDELRIKFEKIIPNTEYLYCMICEEC